MSQTLRGAKHPYYCSEGNYHTNDANKQWSSWAGFMVEFGDADVDMNLVWRWDWTLPDPDDDPEDQPAEHLTLFMMKQRKARNESHEIAVTEADEPAVRAYLAKHAATMAAIWAPFALANHPNDPDLNVVAVPCADLLGLLAERDRLAARVLELEAPGECQSLHKLRAEVDVVCAARDRLASRVLELSEAERVAITAPLTVTELNALPNRVRRYVHDIETRCDPAGDIATIASLTEQRDALVLKMLELQTERDELAAEVAAWQGRPDGALPGWEWSEADGPAYVRPYGGRVPLVVYVTGQWFGDEVQGAEDSPRAAMRAAEAAARSRGWM